MSASLVYYSQISYSHGSSHTHLRCVLSSFFVGTVSNRDAQQPGRSCSAIWLPALCCGLSSAPPQGGWDTSEPRVQSFGWNSFPQFDASTCSLNLYPHWQTLSQSGAACSHCNNANQRSLNPLVKDNCRMISEVFGNLGDSMILYFYDWWNWSTANRCIPAKRSKVPRLSQRNSFPCHRGAQKCKQSMRYSHSTLLCHTLGAH